MNSSHPMVLPFVALFALSALLFACDDYEEEITDVCENECNHMIDCGHFEASQEGFDECFQSCARDYDEDLSTHDRDCFEALLERDDCRWEADRECGDSDQDYCEDEADDAAAVCGS